MSRTSKRNEKLSQLDRQILSILSRDATVSYAELGAAVGLSPAATHERVRKLKQNGTIQRIAAVVAPEVIENRFLCFILLKIEGTDKMTKVHALSEINEVEEIHTIAGEYSILIKARSFDTDHMEEIFCRIYQIPGIVQSQTIVSFGTYVDRPSLIAESGT
ncbi:Lrp/AsnC family transcriptional regulator [Salinarimonas sp.]|uniref:Lrp/AsnC family transcriptional regulator n=1 Tax=Salinarimonas sp. TaxID=2766526 RepID=UPI003918F871